MGADIDDERDRGSAIPSCCDQTDQVGDRTPCCIWTCPASNLVTLRAPHPSGSDPYWEDHDPFFAYDYVYLRFDGKIISFDPLRPMSVQQTVKTQQRIHQRASQGRLVNMHKNTARLFSACEKKGTIHTSQPLRRNTAAPTKDVLIGLLLHLSTLAAPHHDFVPPADTVACARSLAGRQLPPRHPKTARALRNAKTHRFAPTSRC